MPPRVAFVNGGILGLLSYATWLRRTFPDDAEIHAEHFVLTEDLDLRDRIVRRVLCQKLWPDLQHMHHVDLARYRREWNSGLVARRRLLARGLDLFDVLHFHRQATAYASLDLMEQRPSIVSIDATQTCVMQDTTSAAERWALCFNSRRDGGVFRRGRGSCVRDPGQGGFLWASPGERVPVAIGRAPGAPSLSRLLDSYSRAGEP